MAAHSLPCSTILRSSNFRISAGDLSSRYPLGGADLQCAGYLALSFYVPSGLIPVRSRKQICGSDSIDCDGVSRISPLCVHFFFGWSRIRWKKRDNRGWVDALLASGYYRAETCGSANCQLNCASHCGFNGARHAEISRRAVPWSKAADSDMTRPATTPPGLVGESVRPCFVWLS